MSGLDWLFRYLLQYHHFLPKQMEMNMKNDYTHVEMEEGSGEWQNIQV